MTAYLILNYQVDDPEAFREYQGEAAPALQIPAECQPLVLTSETELIEGTSCSSNTVVLKFESKERAREIYESDAYQAILGKRLAATSNHFAILTEGLG